LPFGSSKQGFFYFDFYSIKIIFMCKVLIIEDHEPMGERLERFLNADKEFEVIGRCLTAEEGLEAILEKKPDVVLSDFSLPGMSGLEMVQALRHGNNLVPVVMLTLFTEQHIRQAALNAGVKEFLPKNVSLEELKESLRSAAS
jgi:DNA-binding NarL/FixJ family response regulator